jgi:hypothetical protein
LGHRSQAIALQLFILNAPQIKYIIKLAQLQYYCYPETIHLTLPGDGKVIPVARFPFISMLYLLLSDPNLVSDLANLDVNPANPRKFRSVVSTSLQNLVKDPEKYFVAPICFASDETKLEGKGKPGAAGRCYFPHLHIYLTKRFATSLPFGAPFSILIIPLLLI